MSLLKLILCLVLDTHNPLDFTERVDMIEINTKVTKNGSELHKQLIFYERIPSTGEYRVRDWVLLDDDAPSQMYPMKNSGDMYECYIRQRNTKKYLTKIESPLLKETTTTYDPEVLDKIKLPEQFRLALIDFWARFKSE